MQYASGSEDVTLGKDEPDLPVLQGTLT